MFCREMQKVVGKICGYKQKAQFLIRDNLERFKVSNLKYLLSIKMLFNIGLIIGMVLISCHCRVMLGSCELNKKFILNPLAPEFIPRARRQQEAYLNPILLALQSKDSFRYVLQEVARKHQ